MKKFLFYKRLSSTQDIAYKLALQGEGEGTVIISDYQTGGRGRLGRKWFAPPKKNLLCSFILRPNMPAEQAFRISRLAVCAIKKAVEEKTDLSVYSKYPNDLLIKGKKFAGVLTETQIKKGKLEFIILGMGVNVNSIKEQFFRAKSKIKNERTNAFRKGGDIEGKSKGEEQPQFVKRITSLREETGKRFSRPALLRKILKYFEKEYFSLCQENLIEVSKIS